MRLEGPPVQPDRDLSVGRARDPRDRRPASGAADVVCRPVALIAGIHGIPRPGHDNPRVARRQRCIDARARRSRGSARCREWPAACAAPNTLEHPAWQTPASRRRAARSWRCRVPGAS